MTNVKLLKCVNKQPTSSLHYVFIEKDKPSAPGHTILNMLFSVVLCSCNWKYSSIEFSQQSLLCNEGVELRLAPTWGDGAEGQKARADSTFPRRSPSCVFHRFLYCLPLSISLCLSTAQHLNSASYGTLPLEV